MMQIFFHDLVKKIPFPVGREGAVTFSLPISEPGGQ
jgi:hypothetical protein